MTAEPSAKKAKLLNHWTNGLVASMQNPDNVILEDSRICVIKDAYPKAKFHHLILPKERIDGLVDLDASHLPLLKHMEETAVKLVAERKEKYQIGYHSVPSLQRLHLHVISDDFVSPCLKTKVHWNSFTTKFFLPSQDLIKMIEKRQRFTQISQSEHLNLLGTPLKCHKCEYIPKNMPTLKIHILTHL